MEAGKLTTILACYCVLLVDGFRTGVSKNNNGTSYGRRILHGEYIDPLQVLYTVQLASRADTIICGGSIIHEYFILTAAQCVSRPDCLELEIYPSTFTGEYIPNILVSECYVHDNYNPMEFLNDIGIVRTEGNLVDDFHLTKIPLAAPGTNYVQGMPAVMIGWGQTETTYYPHFIVRGLAVVYNWHMCTIAYQNAAQCIGSGDCPALEIPQKSFCTIGVPESPASSCLGDFGGPVIIDGFLAGIMSAAIIHELECQEGTPSLHLQVSADYT